MSNRCGADHSGFDFTAFSINVLVLLIRHVPSIIFSVNKTYYSITLYASVYHAQSFLSVTLLDVGSCKTFCFSKRLFFCLILYKEVRVHMIVGLLIAKSLCCSWLFVVLCSSPALTEFSKLYSNSARSHYNFTTHSCSD